MSLASVTVLCRSLRTDRIVARLALDALLDPALAARYAADPRVVLAERGVELAAGELAPDLASAEPLQIESLNRAREITGYSVCALSANRALHAA